MNKIPYYIGVDWLQIFCKGGVNLEPSKKGAYNITLLNYSSRHFKKIFSISLGVDEIAQVQAEPHSNIIKTGDAILKLTNKFCYSEKRLEYLEVLMSVIGLEFVSVTRCDICIDFEHFLNYYTPENLMTRFVSGKIIKHGKNKFKLQGHHTHELNFDYLKFGSPTSNISYYLYNKSKELREVKNKPWIIDTWALNNLNNDKDIWRLEFSIKKMKKDATNMDDGTNISLSSLALFIRENFECIIKYLIQKLWKFSTLHNWSIQKNKSRCITIDFFKFDIQNIDLIRYSEKITSNRMDKIFIKKLESLKNDYGYTGSYFDGEIDTIASYFKRTRGLKY